jgi:hypothetical protein
MKHTWLKRYLAALALCVTILPLQAGEKEDAGVKAAEAWLMLVDAEQYQESWKEAASFFRERTTPERWEQIVKPARGAFGALKERKLKSATYMTALPGAPDGEYVVIQFTTAFEKKQTAIETVTPMMDTDGKWRVSGYYIK